MRVWELARALGKESSELLAELQELGFDVTAPASGLSDEEASQIRGAYAALGDVASTEASGDAASEATVEEDLAAGEGTTGTKQGAQAPQIVPRPGDYVLVRKASISAGGVVVRKGGTIREEAYRTLPARVHQFFDKA